MPVTIPSRSEIKPEHTWNAEALFPDPEAWQQEYESLRDSLANFTQFQGKLNDPTTLLNWINTKSEIERRIWKLYAYSTMDYSVDTGNQPATARNSQAQGLLSNFRAAVAFAEPEILQIGLEKLRLWLHVNDKLAPYKHYFQNLYRQQAHVRSAEVEEVMGMVAAPFGGVSTTASVLTNSELEFAPAHSSTGEESPVTQGTWMALLTETDRETRRTTWESYADGYLKFKNTLANNLITAVKQDVFTARVRRYDSALEAALEPYNIPTSVFHNLIDTYRRHLPTWHRYWRIRRKALGVDKLHPYDIWSPLTPKEPEILYSEAVDMICEGMQPLGEDYVRIMREGCLGERWVDIYPNTGKRQGAFSMRWGGTYPYIMMSYTDDLPSMSTLAHELGHSMHAYLTWENQPVTYMYYSIFVAEVASNFNQALVRDHLLKTRTDPHFLIAVIEEAMKNFHRYFFIMPTLARFEHEIHQRIEQGKGVTAEDMNSLMTDLFREGYGDEIHIDPDRVGITWAQFQHMYMNYYVFQYATGISGAHALAQRVLDEGENAAQDYLGFLKGGASMYPLDILKHAGVDLTTPEPVEKTFGILEVYVDRLEQLVEQV